MKATQGYLSEDGTFFESKAECELYEVELLLDKMCESHGFDPTKYKQLVRLTATITVRYINAYETHEEEVHLSKAGSDQPYATSINTSSDTGAEAVAARLLELSSGSGEHMPEMGSSECATDVSDTSQGVRTGSGTLDAPGVRRSEDLATDTPAEARRTRRRDRPQGTRE